MSSKKQRPIILLGGVGPLAGVLLHRRIIENTLSETDQDHLEIHHYSRSHDIPDRTEFLQDQGDDPVPGMARTLSLALRALSDGEEAAAVPVVGIPCNTFHAPAIFDRFMIEVQSKHEIQVIHMIREMMRLLSEQHSGVRKVGLLSTTGTRMVGIYERMLEENDIRFIQVPPGEQDTVHQAICDRNWGIKASGAPTDRAIKTLREKALGLADAGSEVVILGCTEIPLALTEPTLGGALLLDPMEALARALIREADPAKLRPYVTPGGSPHP